MIDYKELNEIIPKYFLKTVQRLPKTPAFKFRDKNRNWVERSWKETFDDVMDLSCALIDLGLRPDDKVSFFSDNRYDWMIVDLALQFSACISVPRGTDSVTQEMDYIIEHSDSVALIIEHKRVYEKIKDIMPKMKNVKHFITIDTEGVEDSKFLSLAELQEKGKSLRDKYESEIEKRLKSLQTEDAYTIIYTSGTTGNPKGVMGMHMNEVHQMRSIPDHIGFDYGHETLLSILPVWHIFERMLEYVCIGAGLTTAYTNIRDIKTDLKEIKPTYMGSAPRLWESIYLGINNTIQAGSPVKKALFKAAYFLSNIFGTGKRFLMGNELRQKPANPISTALRSLYYILIIPIVYLPYKLLDIIVLKKIRAATGGQMKGSVSGGGALPSHVDAFFNNIGIPVLEGYGMTESAPVIAVRQHHKLVLGSVGPLLPEVEVEIRDFEGNVLPTGEKGVIWTKGPHVMKGYYKNPQKTAETVVDGWLNTGDMGFISYNGTLSIRGRAKETIVLLGGENIEPVPIENKLLESPYISQVMVVGQDQKYLGALIFPDIEKIAAHLDMDAEKTTSEVLSKDDRVEELISYEIKNYISGNTGFKGFERVVQFRFIPKSMDIGDEVTNLGKMRRHIITEKYQYLIDEMYQDKK